ncbi:porin family protein [Sphingobacterium sp. SYP-B4668]|uniref:porin family protein n=1 Tax=Sphingobacterium sp. SYP-B4668 TaxID=2996035 RepID=UPI0022DE3D07|nr:porin family protein [Sphingobacterium sp. SYP-B4668]
MKQLNLLFAFILFSVLAHAQYKPQVEFGAKAGLAFPTFQFAEGGNPKTYVSGFIGGFVDLPIAQSFSIQPGVTLSGKGYNDKYFESETDFGQLKTRLLVVDVPVHLVGKMLIGDDQLHFGVGPYIGFNVAGKQKFEGQGNRYPEGTIDFEFNKKDFKRQDYGISLMANYKFDNGMLVNMGYGLGLANLYGSEVDNKVKNRVLSLGVGIQL